MDGRQRGRMAGVAAHVAPRAAGFGAQTPPQVRRYSLTAPLALA